MVGATTSSVPTKPVGARPMLGLERAAPNVKGAPTEGCCLVSPRFRFSVLLFFIGLPQPLRASSLCEMPPRVFLHRNPLIGLGLPSAACGGAVRL